MSKKKKYALNNSYFKNIQFQPEMPKTMMEIANYYDTNGELPFEYNGNNWVYDAFCEKQKRSGVFNSQFFTPDKTAEKIADLALTYHTSNEIILDACCGSGQLSKALLSLEPNQQVHAFDFDTEMVDLFRWQFCKESYSSCFRLDFTDEKDIEKNIKMQYQTIVSNPPYENIPQFLEFAREQLRPGGTAIFLMPSGTFEKTRPMAFVKELQKWSVIERCPMQEEFERTKIKADIYVLKLRP